MKVAEAAKVSNAAHLNIALVNELAIIFRLLGIDTLDILEAAGGVEFRLFHRAGGRSLHRRRHLLPGP